MVVPLGPGKFYGSSLPRPRIYTDVKFNSDRVDPPVPVMDPFLSWAHEAHWSMGGLSFKRLRLQGRIEGNVNRLRKQKEKEIKSQVNKSPPKDLKSSSKMVKNGKRMGSVLPPPAPRVVKRRKFMDLFDEESEEEEEEVVEKTVGGGRKRLAARKLVGEFERVAKESGMGVKTRRGLEGVSGGIGDDVMKVVEEVNKENFDEGKKLVKGKSGSTSVVGSGIRTSPRLAKQRSS